MSIATILAGYIVANEAVDNIRQHKSSDGQKKKCPKCGSLMNSEDIKCSKCGYSEKGSLEINTYGHFGSF